MKLAFYPNSEQQANASMAWQDDTIDDVLIGGGAGGGKSFWECSMLVLDAMRWPDTRYFIGRKELKRLMQTTYITLTQEVFKALKLVRDYHWKFDGKYNVIYLRQGPGFPWSAIDLLDVALMPTDPLYDRYGSALYTRGMGEEISEWPFKAYDVLRSRVGRYRNKELGIKGKMGLGLNPSEDWPYRLFYDPWKKSGRPTFDEQMKKPLISIKGILDGEEVMRNFVFVPVLAKDNPDIGKEYRINLATISDPVLKARLAEGDWEFSNANDVLFPTQAIADLYAESVNVPYSNKKYLTVDSARLGGDKIVRMFWRGKELYKIKWDVKKRTNETADIIENDIAAEGIPREHVLIDDPGGGVVDRLEGVIQFTGASSPFGKVGEMEVREHYENLRSQCVYYMSRLVQDRKIKVSELDLEIREMLAEELKHFKRRDADKDGKLKISRKEEEIKPALGRSPDFADAFWMRAYFDLRKREPKLNKGDGVARVHSDGETTKRKKVLGPVGTVYIQD